jgi:flavin reductase (DIM6/NTAB) family NADH-FMN oxidoreductase RutF
MSSRELELRHASDATAAPISPDAFKLAFRQHPGGVALITADPGDRPVALTATSVISISAEPPVLVFSLSALSGSTPIVRASKTVVVHLLSSQRHDLARLGATSGVDRFEDTTRWSRLPTGEPVFHEVENWIRAEVTDHLQVGGSTVVVATAIETSGRTGSEAPLVYVNRTWHRLDERSELAG